MKKLLTNSSIFVGSIAGIWAATSILSGLAVVDWSMSEFIRQYLVSIGLIRDFNTFSDFYTHIKGVEYLIALSFLGFFPVFYGFLNKKEEVVSFS